jgi:glycosyltransferase involved in cell wall biosynthesis
MNKRKLKILHLVTIFPQFESDVRGIFSKRHVLSMAEEFDNYVLAPLSPISKKAEVWSDVKIVRFQYWFNKTKQKIGYGLDTRRNISGSFIAKIQVVPYLLAFLINSVKLGKKIDIYHSHNTFTAMFAIWANYIRREKKPIITTSLGSDIKYLPNWYNKSILRHISAITFPAPLYASSGYTHPGKKSLEEMLEEINGLDKFHEIYFQLNEKQFDYRLDKNECKKRLGFADKFVVAFLSNLREDKGPLYFLRAIPSVLSKEPDIRFLMIGLGPLKKEVEHFRRTHGLEKNLVLHPPMQDIQKLMAASDMMCQMCTEENLWSTVLAEALAMRLPCVISNVGLTNRLYTHKKDAYLVDLSAESLAEAILELHQNSKLRKAIADNGWALLESRGRRDEISRQKFSELYRSLSSSRQDLPKRSR